MDVLTYLIPGLLVLLTAFGVMFFLIQREVKLKKLELRGSSGKNTLPLRLQAFERMALFLERIHFDHIIPRLRKAGMSVGELELLLSKSIRQEWEHNLAQQIYLSEKTWETIRLAKDETLQIIHHQASALDKKAPAEALIKALFDFSMNSEEPLPYQKALDQLKAEARVILE